MSKNKSTKPKTLKDLKDLKAANPEATAADAMPVAESELETKRPVQTEIPGTEGVKIKAIDEASELYVNARDKRMNATEKEIAAKTALSDLMHKHADKIGRAADGSIVYRYDDMIVSLTPKEEVLKVKHVDPEETGVVTVGKAPEDNSEGE